MSRQLLLSHLLLLVAGTLREANTGAPIRQTDLARTERTSARTEVGDFSKRRASFHLAAYVPLLLLGVAAPAAHQVPDVG
jgi:hypothetical protein